MNKRMLSAAFVAVVSMFALMLTAPAQATASTSSWTLGGLECDLIPTTQEGVEVAAPPVGVGPFCSGVRPGGVVTSDAGQCSFNFMWKDPSGNRYMGTAGHCIIDGGQQTWSFGSGPVARDRQGLRVGEFVYAVLQDPKDFALIRLDSNVPANPQMCHFGGPTGQNDDLTSANVVINHYGQGLGVSQVVPGRTAVATYMMDPNHVYADGAVVFGDSGSSAISSDGRALGVVVTTGLHFGSAFWDKGTMGITRLKPQVQAAQSALGVSLTLQTAALLP
ncbi:MAG: trypsin-like serine protease [Actinomycetota bacterium]